MSRAHLALVHPAPGRNTLAASSAPSPAPIDAAPVPVPPSVLEEGNSSAVAEQAADGTTSAPAAQPLPDPFERDVHCILGLPFDALTVSGTVSAVWRAVADRTPLFFSTPNLNFVVGALDDAAFRDSVLKSDLSVPDGMPIVWVARVLGVPITERVGGSTVFELLHEGSAGPLRFYLFGGQDGVAEVAARRLTKTETGIVCCGYESPGFGPVEALSTPDRIARINASRPDFLVVSLGAKKGQAWIEHNRARLDVPVVSHLGAALNFAAGTVRRAPRWMQIVGLEWLWRIKEEPQLWARYLRDGLAFVRLFVTHVLPLRRQLARHRPTPVALAAAAIETEDLPGGAHVLRLIGPWTQDNIARLRPRFAAAARHEGPLRLDLGRATCVDPAVMGLMMVLLGVRKRAGRAFACGPINGNVRRVFRLACAEYMLEAYPGGAPAEGFAKAATLKRA